MAKVNEREQQINQLRTERGQYDYDLWDGMGAAVDSTLRALPTSSIIRGVANMFDNSKELTFDEANEKFGLSGEAAYEEGDTGITVSQAKARSEDDARNYRNDMITSIVNEDSPVAGRTTQFVASLAAGFADPTLLAMNLGASVGLAAGVGKLAASETAMNAVIGINQTAGRMLMTAYAENASIGLGTYIAREGAENLVGSVLEETINFIGVGEDRLARKVTLSESLNNIVLGTVLGTGIGGLTKGGRDAIAHTWAKGFGDSTASIMDVKNKTSAMEMAIGIEKTSFAEQMLDVDMFEGKEWHTDKFVPYVDARESIEASDMFLSLDADNVVHSYSNRGDGIVLTTSSAHAQNAGKSVRRVDGNQLKIFKPSDLIGTDGRTKRVRARVVNKVSDDFINNATDEQITKTLALLDDPDVDMDNVTTGRNKTAARKKLKQELHKLGDMEDIVDFINEVNVKTGHDYNVHKSLDTVLAENGFDGYTFKGKNNMGQDAYDGVYVSKKASHKLQTKEEFDVPEPSPAQKMRMQIKEETMLRDYSTNLDAAYAKQAAERDAMMLGEQETPATDIDPEYVAPKNDQASALLGTADKAEYMKNTMDELEAKLENGKNLTPSEETRLQALKHAFEDGDMNALMVKERAAFDEFVACVNGE